LLLAAEEEKEGRKEGRKEGKEEASLGYLSLSVACFTVSQSSS
jgi:predicted transposase YdaD